MRKTSKDTGDTMSVNSGVENDIRKSDISTKKRNSIKKKVQNFSHESDDTALVTLLQTYKDKPDIAKQSAKYTLSKTKTDSIHEEEEDILKNKDKDIERGNLCKPATTAHNISTNIVNERSKMLDSVIVCSPTTHVFGSKSMTSSYNTTTNSLLIEMNDKTTSSVNTNALIFTTAKIHTDSKPKTMDSIQLSSTPILSTAEGNFIRAEITPILCNLPPKLDLITASNLNKGMSQSTNEPACKANSKKSGQATNEIKTLLDKSSTYNFVDKILEKDVKDMSKVLPSTTSTPLPTYFYTAGIHREQNNQVKNKPGDDTEITMKTDTQITKDENKINSKIMNDNKKSADTKLENTSSIKKLQRQKHAAVEESNNSNMTHSENKKKNIESQVEKSTKTIDTPNTNPLKTNGSIQTDTLKRTTLSTVQTKIVKTCPMSCTSGTENIATVSTTAPISKSVTTVKSITTGAKNSNKETSSDSSSLLKFSSDTKGPGSGSTQSTSTVKLINTSKDVKDETKDLVTKIVMPTTSITASTSTQPFSTFKLPQTSSVSKIDNAKKSAPLTSTCKVPPTVDKTLKINKTKPNSSMESESFAINSKQSSVVSTSSNNVPVCTPLYIVATSKTKIGGTPTSNTAGISKAQIDNSITQVVSTVRTTPTAIGKPLDIPMSEIDPKDLKIKPTTSKSSLKK
ncbi:topoisomerase I damage affected protein 7-like isoform X1 [Zerene cesonia]|uniref:topoisomerase I damage affected protein 7-like isoform X1 n=1 Tax=Zerene cesonia TaxID=33412 RepID=UPI0018E54343|nr:topoisomerase I damage affected protein 7-like isoform X1 [Zerene cesonia]